MGDEMNLKEIKLPLSDRTPTLPISIYNCEQASLLNMKNYSIHLYSTNPDIGGIIPA